MISKRYLLDHIDTLYEELNGLNIRVLTLERKLIEKDLGEPVRRGRGRPRKQEPKNAPKK